MGPERIEVEAPDGHYCYGVLELPEGPGPFPGVVAVHGGMDSQEPEWLLELATSDRFAPRRLLKQGYAVLTSDYRHPSFLNREVDDTIAAYEALRRHPAVIDNKVALCGTSHGAVCSIYAAMRIRPACIVAEEGSTDLAYRYRRLYEVIGKHDGEPEGYLKLDKELWDEFAGRMGGPPDLVPEAYEQASGHSRAHQIQSPILIITGDGEYCPHCLTMYAALLKANKECDFGMYQDAPHSFWFSGKSCPALAQANQKVLSFLSKYLRD
jgi:dipeptidyl aminopeptidase/acylaminoacyl peptidase